MTGGPAGGGAPVSSGAGVRDPGLQPERTRLAWRRTALAFTVVAVLAARQVAMGSAEAGPDVVAVVGWGAGALVWLAFLVVAHRRARALRASSRPAVLPGRTAWAATGCAVVLALSAVTLLW
ncbi:DUF202 domain-containing protein [Streptomyces sp. NPDC020875]|uniref:DUF202 domain-containing protein n=1 Tax=Streptomyces sp. NPDC020875 TaxID=3154898 RepID=UPI0033CC2038